MIKIIRHASVGDVLCAAKLTGNDLVIYLPLTEITQAGADALADVLTACALDPDPVKRGKDRLVAISA